MPFTFSHPAIVLPLFKLWRQWFSLTGLVIGSITPDFEYFIRMRIQSSISHTPVGLFLFDLPVGLLLTFVFHNIIRNRLYDNLPMFIKRRVSIYKTFNWNNYCGQHWLIVIISVFIGALSHLLWDGFTHSHGIFVEIFPVLTTRLHIVGNTIPLYRLLQHVSTLAGAWVIGVAILNMPVLTKVDSYNSKYWPVVSLIVLIVVILRLLVGVEQSLVGLTITIISSVLIAITIVPFLVAEKINS